MAKTSYSPPCPTPNLHTPHPKRQFAHEAWAMQMLRTHNQKRCPGCGLWTIWEPRPDAPALPPIEYRLDHDNCGCCNGDPDCGCTYHRDLP